MMMKVIIQTLFMFFFFNDTATTEIYTLSLHDALPICGSRAPPIIVNAHARAKGPAKRKKDRLTVCVTVLTSWSCQLILTQWARFGKMLT